MEKCKWFYRPGRNNSHYALTTCERGFNYLSKLKDCEPYVGVADVYNGCECPICGKEIELDYSVIEK